MVCMCRTSGSRMSIVLAIVREWSCLAPHLLNVPRWCPGDPSFDLNQIFLSGQFRHSPICLVSGLHRHGNGHQSRFSCYMNRWVSPTLPKGIKVGRIHKRFVHTVPTDRSILILNHSGLVRLCLRVGRSGCGCGHGSARMGLTANDSSAIQSLRNPLTLTPAS